ncbi:hypothetical protein GOHSU_18_00040 [Gordonia hirsuta DSM 44140 = NBRC 16056]|uniref:NfeD-like C-terminal domain-containing protein n=1 Tax=Gordonia hirsuta DSM 44140 = NBRC 16056 TaxID=1121927 RepID=L7L8J3_9ACTN|nr:hypothetical protein [Gordonia hirsuta]GAC57249.1 hypothetical protein GOHSU_18_00040 [Gordonia hirsuta DSM 44140 = NBRC 16056]
MLGIILLIIGCVGLALTLLSLVGADLGSFDVDLGDSGVGFTSILMPFVTGFGLLTGGLIVFGDVGTPLALLIGALAGLVLAMVAGLTVRWLWRSGQELPEVEILGSSARVVEPVSPGRYGTATVDTPLGERQVTVTGNRTFAHNDRVRIVARHDVLDAYVVEQLPFSDLDT